MSRADWVELLKAQSDSSEQVAILEDYRKTRAQVLGNFYAQDDWEGLATTFRDDLDVLLTLMEQASVHFESETMLAADCRTEHSESCLFTRKCLDELEFIRQYDELWPPHFGRFEELSRKGQEHEDGARPWEAISDYLLARSWASLGPGGSDYDVADMEDSIGNNWRSLERLDLSLAAFERALEFGLEKDLDLQGRLANNFALTLRIVGRLDEAVENYEKAIECWQQAGQANTDRLAWIAGAHDNLGNVFGMMGDQHRALARHRAGLQIQEKICQSEPTADHLDGLAGAYTNLGITLREQGFVEEGLEHNLKARDLVASINDSRLDLRKRLAIMELNLANAYCMVEDYEKAINCYRSGILIYRELAAEGWPGMELNIGQAQSNLALTLGYADSNERATEIQLRALQTLEAIPRRTDDFREFLIASSYSNLAGFYQACDKHEESFAAYQKSAALWEGAIEIYPAGKSRYLNVLIALSDFYIDNNDLESRLSVLRRTDTILQDLIQKQGQLSFREDLALNTLELGELLLRLDNASESVPVLERALSLLQATNHAEAIDDAERLLRMARRALD